MKKINNAPINVKMCQIPHYIGFNNKPKASIITSSYFNINLKNKANLILNKRKVNNNNTNKNERNKTNKELKSNYYSLIIANNRNKHLPNKNSVNFSKLSINSLITNSINKSKKIINNRRKNIINEEEYSIISKKKNYSFKIKVNKIKEKLNLGNSRNSSLKNMKMMKSDEKEIGNNLSINTVDEFINVEFKPDNDIDNSFSTIEAYDLIIQNSFIMGIFDNDVINNKKLPLLQFLYITKDHFMKK